MKVGIDYTAAIWQGAGIGRYTRELVQAAVALGGPVEYVLFYAAQGLPPDSPYRAHLRNLCSNYPQVHALPIPLSPRLLTILWQRLRLPLRVEYFTGPLDVLHAPDFVLPPTREHTRTILTVHDLTFLTHPECFEPSLQRYLARVVPRSLQRASLVLADSHATQNDLSRLLNVPPERSIVVYPGVAGRFAPLPPEQCEPLRQQLNLPPAFLLFVGTLEPRKNLVRLLHAFDLLIRRGEPYEHLSLLVVGRKGWLYQDFFSTRETLSLESRVQVLDFVDDEMLPTLYNLAEAFVYPSLSEGFGLPVVEALACGVPVVTTNGASLPEVAGEAAILVDPYLPEAIAEGIARALASAQSLRAAGPARAQWFTWEQAARGLLTCYLDVSSR